MTTAPNEIFSGICKYLSENETPLFRGWKNASSLSTLPST
jgi:hypothetical protein